MTSVAFDERPLGDLVTFINGDRSANYPSTTDNREDGIPFVSATELEGDRINFAKVRRISHEAFNRLNSGKVQDRDILFCLRGTLGKIARVKGSELGAIASSLVIIRAREEVDSNYLFYVLGSPAWQANALLLDNGSAQPNISVRALQGVSVPVPTFSEQHAIARILGAFDDKIELNRRMNETLEAMARALFKSWFVEFDPVHRPRSDAVARAAHFPGTLEETPYGSVPAGWSWRTVGDLCRRVAMGPFGSDIKTDNFVEEGVPIIRGGNLTKGFVEDDFVFLTEQKADELRNANAYRGDIVITHRGTLGQVGLIPRQSRFPRYVVSQSQMLLSVDPSVATSRYVYDFLSSPAGIDALLANTSQTGVPAIARPTTSLKAIPILVPPLEVLSAYEKISAPIADRQIANIAESRALAQARDTLLPKLISGEVRIL